MTKKKIVILCISILLVIGILVGAYFYFFTNAFKPLLSEVLGYQGKNITKMVITPTLIQEEMTTDPNDIAEIIDAFKDVKVLETEALEPNRDGGHSLVFLYSGDELVAHFDFNGNRVTSGDTSYIIDKEIPSTFRKYLKTKYTLF